MVKSDWKAFFYTLIYSGCIFGSSLGSMGVLGMTIKTFENIGAGSVVQIGVGYTTLSIGTIVSCIVPGILRDLSVHYYSGKWYNLTPQHIHIVCMLLLLLANFLLPFSRHYVLIAIFQFFIGLGFNSQMVIVNSVIPKFTSKKLKSSFMQFFMFFNGLGGYISPVFIGPIVNSNKITDKAKLYIVYFIITGFNLLVIVPLVVFKPNILLEKILEEKKEAKKKDESEGKIASTNSLYQRIVDKIKNFKVTKKVAMSTVQTLTGTITTFFFGSTAGVVNGCTLVFMLEKGLMDKFQTSQFISMYFIAGVVARVVVFFGTLNYSKFQAKTIYFFIINVWIAALVSILYIFFYHVRVLNFMLMFGIGYCISPIAGMVLTSLVEFGIALSGVQISVIIMGLSVGFAVPSVVLKMMESNVDAYLYVLCALICSELVFAHVFTILLVSSKGKDCLKYVNPFHRVADKELQREEAEGEVFEADEGKKIVVGNEELDFGGEKVVWERVERISKFVSREKEKVKYRILYDICNSTTSDADDVVEGGGGGVFEISFQGQPNELFESSILRKLTQKANVVQNATDRS